MIKLTDKYELDAGRGYLNGLQAIVRIMVAQARRDKRAGLNTAGFISGYRGSPLAGIDTEIRRAEKILRAHDIRFQPGVNEDLAATAIWGTQQLGFRPGATREGVFAMWYGKGPGVDRCGDVFKHGNMVGSAAKGGVLLVMGDDHANKSSTFPHQSDYAMVSAACPILNPAGLQDYVRFGLLGIGLSRFSGCWVGFKATGEVVESSMSLDLSVESEPIVDPAGLSLPSGGLSIRHPDNPLEQERRLIERKLPAAQAFARANGLDRVVVGSSGARLAIVATGKAYLDLREGLRELGVGEADLLRLGIAIYKVGMSWPIEPSGVRAFTAGAEEVLVVEEKRGLVEEQLARIFANWDRRPARLVGKTDETGKPLFPEFGEITSGLVARVVAQRLERLALVERGAFDHRLAVIARHENLAIDPAPLNRQPYFCAGCPHNTSTKTPDGSRALAGIGCHAMAMWMPQARAATVTQMGGEGANWIGLAPFTNERHIFQNLGDGTYFHSGLLAIRAAIAAKTNITYKILFNDAVAMTGGQAHDGPLDPMAITRQVHAEGVRRIAVVSDEPEKYPSDSAWASGATIHHRRELDAVQRDLRDVEGVTVIVYDQTCAAEKRRRRKRAPVDVASRRLFINQAVCEACGDCSIQSNCVAVQPVETEFGRKRQIDQFACNLDHSCVEGFCPSFVSVRGATLRNAPRAAPSEASARMLIDVLPTPQPPERLAPSYNILLAGMGGTGVVTVAAILGMAAHIEGTPVSVLDQTGLSQKNGAVASHVRIGRSTEQLDAARIGKGQVDLLLGCDLVVSSGSEALTRMTRDRSAAVVSSHMAAAPTFIFNPDEAVQSEDLLARINRQCRADGLMAIEAHAAAVAWVGDPVGANVLLLGYAFQKGLIPLSEQPILEAIRLNGAAVELNIAAFMWGRALAHDPKLAQISKQDGKRPTLVKKTISELIQHRAELLRDYQDEAYATRYRNYLVKIQAHERQAMGVDGRFSETVAESLFRLMAYKDEYEVARLHTLSAFAQQLHETFDGKRLKISVHLAPPLLARRDKNTGHPRKMEFGPWIFHVFRMLAGMKRLRGSPFDPFGWTAERRAERRWISDYGALFETLSTQLSAENFEIACQLAELPQRIRGFGHIKERNFRLVESQQSKLLAEFEQITRSVEHRKSVQAA